MTNSSLIIHQRLLRKQLEWFLSPKSAGLEFIDGEHAPLEQAELIASSYNLLYSSYEWREVSSKNTKSSVKSLPIYFEAYADQQYIQPVIRLSEFINEKCSEFISQFWVHGSIATQDYIKGWSDLDTYLIVKKSTLLNPSKLCLLRGLLIDAYDYLLEFDPLQHHGFMVCSEVDLNNYLPSFLPTKVLAESRYLLGESIINFSCYEVFESDRYLDYITDFLQTSMKTGIFRHHPRNNEYLVDNYGNMNTMYQLKNFISLINILPLHFFNSLGIQITKKESFERINSFEIKAIEILKAASNVRDCWNNKERHPFLGNTIPDWVVDIFGENYFERAFKFALELSTISKNMRL